MKKNNFEYVKVLHLYDNSSKLQLDSCKNLFLLYKKYDIVNFDLQKDFDLVLIEIEFLNKDLLINLNKIVKLYSSKEIVIFTKDNENSFLLKFALHFSLNKIYPLNIKDSEFKTVLTSLIKKITLQKEERRQIEISKKINSIFAFLIFKADKLIFSNEKAKRIFNENPIGMIENFIKNNEKICKLLLGKKNKIEVLLPDSKNNEWKYEFFIESLNKSEKLITIVPLEKIENSVEKFVTKSRFQFIEILKDKLAQNSIELKELGLISINLNNFEKLLDALGYIVMHEFVKKFIEKLFVYKKELSQDIFQWSSHCFILLVEDYNFENLKIELDALHQKLILTKIDEKISPIITSTLLNISKFEINDTTNTIEQINKHSYSKNAFNSCDFYEINHFNSEIDENELINHTLKTFLANKTPIKLLNIYKGLCINTRSKVLKVEEDNYYLHSDTIQGYSMQFEQKTVLQIPDLEKDIEANVVYVNIEKSYVVINDLKLLETSANSRKNTRVQPSIRTPINISFSKSSFSGYIMDISTKAVAIILNHSLPMELKNTTVKLKFKLPNELGENGFFMMDIEGKVIFIESVEETKTKVVVETILENPFDVYLLKYMYNRQKELILELKKAVKVHSNRK